MGTFCTALALHSNRVVHNMSAGYGRGQQMASSINHILELKYHVINGRLTQAKKLLSASQLSLEEICDDDSNTPLHWCAHALALMLSPEWPQTRRHLRFFCRMARPRTDKTPSARHLCLQLCGWLSLSLG